MMNAFRTASRALSSEGHLHKATTAFRTRFSSLLSTVNTCHRNVANFLPRNCHATQSHAVQGVARDAAVAYYGDAAQEIERAARRDATMACSRASTISSRSRPSTTSAKIWERRPPSSCAQRSPRSAAAPNEPLMSSSRGGSQVRSSRMRWRIRSPRADRHLPTDRGRSILAACCCCRAEATTRREAVARRRRAAIRLVPVRLSRQMQSSASSSSGKPRRALLLLLLLRLPPPPSRRPANHPNGTRRLLPHCPNRRFRLMRAASRARWCGIQSSGASSRCRPRRAAAGR